MRARAVPGLDPRGTLAANAARIVATRLEEVVAFLPVISDPAQVEALHDMRIAAKRLRYVLDLTGEACFGPPAAAAAGRMRELQDLIGEIHDLDELLERIERAGIADLAAAVRARRAERFSHFLDAWAPGPQGPTV